MLGRLSSLLLARKKSNSISEAELFEANGNALSQYVILSNNIDFRGLWYVAHI